MTNKDIANALTDLTTLMELHGEHPYRIRLYARAARQIDQLQEPATDLSARGELESVRSIGSKIGGMIETMIETGELPGLNELREALPEGLFEMTAVPGLGAKRVRYIYEQLGITDVDALAKACEAGEIEKLRGFGKKTAQSILRGVSFLQQHRGQFLCHTAQTEAEALRAYLSEQPGVTRLAIAGNVRRCAETTEDVVIVASAKDREELAEAFGQYPGAKEMTGRGKTKARLVLDSGMRAELRLAEDAAFPHVLHHFTGSREHNAAMRQRAKDRGMKLDESGLFQGDEGADCPDEKALFAALGLHYIPPELREGRGEIERAARGPLPELVARADLKGTLHVHTTYSDGRHGIEAMARAAKALGHTYIGICDHSKAAAYAHGLTEDRVRSQWDEIDRVAAEVAGIRILKGIEVDILSDGRLDFDDAFLAEFDLVVASVHSKFSMTEKEATARLIRAVQNPHVDILGHPTGRLLLAREGYPVDMRAVIDVAANTRTAIEINANPARLDLDWRFLEYAQKKGVQIPINTDAHSIEELENMRYGLGIARKGGLTPADVLNALSAEDFLTALRK